MINPYGLGRVGGLLRLNQPKIQVTPWPFSNDSAITVKRDWAANMLSLYRRHDPVYARKLVRHMRAWRKAWGW